MGLLGGHRIPGKQTVDKSSLLVKVLFRERHPEWRGNGASVVDGV
jgi:hypothetical protein